MKRLLLACVLVLSGVSIFFSNTSFALEAPEAPRGSYILDSADILNSDQEATLNSQIDAFKKASTTEVGILTIKDGEGVNSAQFAVEVGREWGIGSRENKNGILILVTLENPKYIQVATTTGIEGALPDALAARIASDEIAPAFKKANYFEGLQKGVSAIERFTKGEYSAKEPKKAGLSSDGWLTIFFFSFVVLQVLFALIAKTKSWWLGGVFGGFGAGLGGFLTSSLVLGLFLGFILVPLGLLIDYYLSKNYKKHLEKSKNNDNYIFPWYFGGGSGGSGFSGGGFSGGFGGGGSFGGGGGGSSW